MNSSCFVKTLSIRESSRQLQLGLQFYTSSCRNNSPSTLSPDSWVRRSFTVTVQLWRTISPKKYWLPGYQADHEQPALVSSTAVTCLSCCSVSVLDRYASTCQTAELYCYLLIQQKCLKSASTLTSLFCKITTTALPLYRNIVYSDRLIRLSLTVTQSQKFIQNQCPTSWVVNKTKVHRNKKYQYYAKYILLN